VILAYAELVIQYTVFLYPVPHKGDIYIPADADMAKLIADDRECLG
jgi:hypothetical protein